MTGSPAADLDTAAAVLAFARGDRAAADAAEADKLQAAVAWAAMHSVDSLAEAATVWDHGETGMPVAGPGAPAGRGVLGDRVRRRDRAARPRPARPTSARPSSSATASSRVWSRVVKGDLPAWRARRVARETMVLSLEAAAYVDRHVAHVAHKVRPAQLDRLVEEAIGRFMPEEAERRRRQAADGRSFTIDTRQPSLPGTSTVYGELDLADALDLDAAVAAGAQALKDLGSTDTLDVRRATAVGDLARRQLTLDLNTPPPTRSPDGDAPDGDRDTTVEPTETSKPQRPASRVRWCCTCTSPTPPSSPAPRWPGSSAGWRTPGVRCTPSRSGSGAATPTPRSPCNRCSTSTSTSTSRPTRSAAGCGNRPS